MNDAMTSEMAAFADGRKEPGTGVAGRAPKLSKAAVVGLLWAPLFFVVVLLSVMVMPPSVVVAAGGEAALPSVAGWQWLLRFTVLPAGLVAPLAVTALGWWAVRGIRRSGGRLYGMRLAVFDGLLFPLLLLDAVVFGLCWWVSGFVLAATGGDVAGATGLAGFLAETRVLGVLLVAVLVSLVLDVVIYLAVWRRVRVDAAE